MELSIFDQIAYENDLSARFLQSLLADDLENESGHWLYKEPEIKTEGNELPTFTILTRTLGLVFIKAYMYNNEDISEVNDKFWVINGQKVKSEINKFRNYIHKISSRLSDPLIEFSEAIPVQTIYAFPYITKDLFNSIRLTETEKLYAGPDVNTLSLTKATIISEADYLLLVNIVQNANIINKTSNKYIDEPAKNMSEAIELNNKRIAQFDYDQMAASLTITEKCERIRGLAGSGKTVLLAIKAAKLHNKYPDKKIAFVFFTKSLYNQANNLIRKYYYQIADDEPNWDNLKVLHSWGGATTGEGFYSYICKENGIVPKTFGQGSFGCLCSELMSIDLRESFDFILVDEAQDFPLEFFNLVYKVLRAPKKVVIAYDELQTTNDVHIPDFEELFGETNSTPNVILEQRYDYILKKSYRNTLDALITAFAFGFGFYDEITQIIQDAATWQASAWVLSPRGRDSFRPINCEPVQPRQQIPFNPSPHTRRGPRRPKHI